MNVAEKLFVSIDYRLSLETGEEVDSSIEGNAEKHFIPYNRDTNIEAFNTYSIQARLEITPEEVADLMQTLESFTCAQ
jgi:hypothetical protein